MLFLLKYKLLTHTNVLTFSVQFIRTEFQKMKKTLALVISLLYGISASALILPVALDYLPGDTVLTDATFFAALNLDYPGFEEVKTAHNRGDLPAARNALCRYYRDRGEGFWREEGYAVPGAEDGLAAVEAFKKITDRTGDFSPDHWFESGEFNWESTDSRFRRMYFFSSLGRAYRYSRDEEIVQVWIDLFRGWIRQMPGGWNRLQTGIRLRSGWGDAFVSFVNSPSFDDESMFLFIKSYYEQALYLRNNHSETSNWLTFEMAGLYSAGVLFPELKAAAGWRDYAVQTALDDLEKGWLPDGFTIELTPGYGTFFSNYLLINQLAGQTGYASEALDRLVQKTERLYEPYLAMMTPDRNVPSWNDNESNLNVPELLAGALDYFPEREDFRWAATEGKEGVAPDFLSSVFPYAGYMVIRSGWGRDAHYMGFDAGPVGYRHAHQDKLGVVLWAYGRQILYDPGRQNYDDEDPMQSYCMDTFSHSTGLVDNRPQRRRWYQNPSPGLMPYQALNDFQYELFPNSVWAAGGYTNDYGRAGSVGNDAYPYKTNSNFLSSWGRPASHYRQVAHAAPDIFVVQDFFVPNDSASHTYEIRWQLDTTNLQFSGHSAQTTADGHPIRMVVSGLHGPAETLDVSEDATVKLSDPDAVFGTDLRLHVNRNAETNLVYLKFDASALDFSIAEIASFEAFAQGTASPRSVAVFAITNPVFMTGWNESTLTWNNAPGNDPAGSGLLPGAGLRVGTVDKALDSTDQTVSVLWDSPQTKSIAIGLLNSGDRTVTLVLVRTPDRFARYASRESVPPNLAVIPLQTDGLQAEAEVARLSPEIQGWKVLETSYPATTLRHWKSGTGNRGFLTWLYPLRPGEEFSAETRYQEDGTILLFTEDGREFEIRPAGNPSERLSVTDRGLADRDGDGIPDWWEIAHFGGPTHADSRAKAANGIHTLKEAYIAGLNPQDPGARFCASVRWMDGRPSLVWNALTGRVYTVYWSTNLTQGFQSERRTDPDGVFTGLHGSGTGFFKLEVEAKE